MNFTHADIAEIETLAAAGSPEAAAEYNRRTAGFVAHFARRRLAAADTTDVEARMAAGCPAALAEYNRRMAPLVSRLRR